jgi:hypothetical protein
MLSAEEKSRIEVWLIDTRCAPVCGDWEQGKNSISYWKLGENRQWSEDSADTFAQSGDKDRPTIFLVHGNRTSSDEAVEFAWPIYCWLKQQPGARQYRLAIWSWPSDRTHKHQRPDVQTKASYCQSQSYYLADCLRGLKKETPVSLVGYSFGSRIIAGGLHLLGGGSVAGRRLPELAASEQNVKRSGPLRAAFVAAAFDCHALTPGCQFGEAMSQVDEVFVTRNRCDDALRWYSLLYGRGGPEALGYVGPCYSLENLRIFETTYCVGKSHRWEDYIDCPNVFQQLPHYLFAEEEPAEK